MPKRPFTHTLGDKAHTRIRQIFIDAGWTVSDIHPDYGEDLLVRIFHQEYSRPLYFFVQSKGAKNISNYLIENKTVLSYSIDSDHLEDWKSFLEPVVLTVWDEKSNVAYWQIVQDALETNIKNKNRKKIHVRIPVENVLDTEGIKRIAMRTVKRFNRFDREEEITNTLLNYLEQRFSIEIDYDEEVGVASVSDDKEITFVFCGKTLDLINKSALYDGLTDEILTDPIRMKSYILKILDEAIEIHKKMYRHDKATGLVYVRDLQNNILRVFKSNEELQKSRQRAEEVMEYDEEFPL